MKKYYNTLLILISMVGFILLFEFILFNFMLGCITWNQELWDQHNSCLTPSRLFGLS